MTSAEIRHSALILDMDGVIVDSEPIHKKADVLTFKTVGMDVPVAVLQRFAGTGADKFFGSILEMFAVEADVESLRRTKNRLLVGFLKEGTPPVPGIFDLISRVKSLGMKLGLASSSDPEVVNTVLSSIGISDEFDCIVDGTAVRRGKPAPDIFIEAARRLSIPPLRSVVVEDSAAGVLAARAALMRCIGFCNPSSGDQDLSPACVRVASLDEITADLLFSLISASREIGVE